MSLSFRLIHRISPAGGKIVEEFYGSQFGMTFPVFVHYGVQLWVPEIGGAIDPGSDAHDLVMALCGGMSKGERNRIKMASWVAQLPDLVDVSASGPGSSPRCNRHLGTTEDVGVPLPSAATCKH